MKLVTIRKKFLEGFLVGLTVEGRHWVDVGNVVLPETGSIGRDVVSGDRFEVVEISIG